ncbi:FHA domain-containing protein [Bifidobacterium sp. DSM 109958]|uniref:FHA domain-containing protein n=1 Tax=Bifidobacterium moraviense TaxID=2675323 RepID=A0A7Y0HZX6_9BIFI|nr:FHA domain-containing protein [Bifidobacterium sp. DSM 109958]NMN00848.1 FHA domain-containing protein [Bifidobacterium sp. DSM 109958]
MTELTFALLKYGFLVLLWVFVWLAVRSLHRDIASFSPKPSRSRRKREKAAKRAASAPVPQAEPQRPHTQQPLPPQPNPSAGPGAQSSRQTPQNQGPNAQSQPHPLQAQQNQARRASSPTLLVVVDGPLAGATVPLTSDAITIGRAASNTVVLNDEFVSGHHARVYADPTSGQWAIEDLGSMNGTVVAGQRIAAPTILPARVPVRIGATTLELR